MALVYEAYRCGRVGPCQAARFTEHPHCLTMRNRIMRRKQRFRRLVVCSAEVECFFLILLTLVECQRATVSRQTNSTSQLVSSAINQRRQHYRAYTDKVVSYSYYVTRTLVFSLNEFPHGANLQLANSVGFMRHTIHLRRQNWGGGRVHGRRHPALHQSCTRLKRAAEDL